jgi:hypothetical protein
MEGDEGLGEGLGTPGEGLGEGDGGVTKEFGTQPERANVTREMAGSRMKCFMVF